MIGSKPKGDKMRKLLCALVLVLFLVGVGITEAAIDWGRIEDTLGRWEMNIISNVAKENGLNEEQTILLFAIRRVENGETPIEFGVGQDIKRHPAKRYPDDPEKSLRTQARWAAGTIKKRYVSGYISRFARLYCPKNWQAWRRMVQTWRVEYTL